jgi:hypothetical protein
MYAAETIAGWYLHERPPEQDDHGEHRFKNRAAK